MAKRKPPTKLGWSAETAEREIIKAARKLTSLQAKRRAVLKALKLVTADITAAKKSLKAITQQAIDADPMTPPLRQFGERQGE